MPDDVLNIDNEVQANAEPQEAIVPEEVHINADDVLNIDNEVQANAEPQEAFVPEEVHINVMTAAGEWWEDFLEELNENTECYALDEDGRLFAGREEIVKAVRELPEGSRLYYYGSTDADYPYAIGRDEDGKVLRSEDVVSPLTPLRKTREIGTTSVRFEDICALGKAEAEAAGDRTRAEAFSLLTPKALKDVTTAEDDYKDYAVVIKNENGMLGSPEKNFQRNLLKVNKEREQNGQKKLFEPVEPDRPKPLTAGERIARYLLRFSTLFLADTARGKEQKKYARDIKQYRIDLKQYNEDMKGLREKRAEEEKVIREKIANAKANVKQAKRKRDELRTKVEGAYRTAAEYVREYRKQPEVRLAGIEDLKKNGLTKDNLFAQVWTLGGMLRGRKYEPESALNGKELEDLMAQYLMAEACDAELLKKYEAKAMVSDAAAQRAVDRLSDESVVSMFKKTAAFQNALKQFEGKTIDPEALREAYHREAENAVSYEVSPAVERLRENRQSLIDTFGTRKVTEDCLPYIARLNLLDQEIRKAVTKGKNYTDEMAIEVVSDLGAQPGGRLRRLEYRAVNAFYGERYQAAIREVAENQKKQAAIMEEVMGAMKADGAVMSDIVKARFEAGARPDAEKTFTLEQMQTFVNEVAQKQAEKAAQQEAGRQL